MRRSRTTEWRRRAKKRKRKKAVCNCEFHSGTPQPSTSLQAASHHDCTAENDSPEGSSKDDDSSLGSDDGDDSGSSTLPRKMVNDPNEQSEADGSGSAASNEASSDEESQGQSSSLHSSLDCGGARGNPNAVSQKLGVTEADFGNTQSSNDPEFLRQSEDGGGDGGSSPRSSSSSSTHDDSSSDSVESGSGTDGSEPSEPSDGIDDSDSSSGSSQPNEPPNYHFPGARGPQDPDEPSDPDDPDSDSDNVSEGSSADYSSGPDNLLNFALQNATLNRLCRSVNDSTAREVLAVILALSVRHGLTYEATINMMTCINLVLGRNYLPTQKKMLWNVIGRNSYGVQKFSYCKRCLSYLGRFRNLNDIVHCECGLAVNKKKVAYFLVMSLKKQFSFVLNRPNTELLLSYRENRQKRTPESIHDILDGAMYAELRQEGNCLHDENNFSYTFNLDGFQLGKRSKTSAWPIFVRWNELPMNVRQKHMFMAGLWVGEKAPNMNAFLRPFVHQANQLSLNGVAWTRNGQRVVSKFVPTCFVADSKARCEVLNMIGPTGYSGCTFCDHPGLYAGGSVKFPVLPPVPLSNPRTHAGIIECMRVAVELNEPQTGVKGPSEIVNLRHFDLVQGVSTDDLHPVFIGVVLFHMTLMLTHANEPTYYIGAPETMATINSRLRSIKTPCFISRKPRNIEQFRKWTGTEWRNWVLYYMVPVLSHLPGLEGRYVRHFALLSNGIFLMSRETISPEDCDVAEACILDYVQTFERFFGRDRMRFNVHVLLHVVDCVRKWGPLFAHSTFTFESWNHILMKLVTSPKGSIDQIMTRFLMNKFIVTVLETPEISARVKTYIESVLNNRPLKNAVQVENVYLLGKGERRQLTDEERLLLQQRNVECEWVVHYQRALVNGVEFRTSNYLYGGEETRSDDSVIYTWNDEFATIRSIALVDADVGRNVFVFATILHTLNPIVQAAHYIVEVNNNAQPVLNLLDFQEIRAHAIKIEMPHSVCIMPTTNHKEID